MAKIKLLIYFLFIFLVFTSYSFAAQDIIPQFSDRENQLEVLYPKIQFIKQFDDFTFNTCVFNASGIVEDNTTTSCVICLTSPNGTVILKKNMFWSGSYFYINIGGGNFSILGGEYAYNINCNNSINGGFASGQFIVNKTGKPFDFDNSLMMVIGLLGTLFVLYWLAFTIKDIHPILSLFILLITLSIYPILGGLIHNMSLGTTAQAMGLSYYKFSFRLIYVIMAYTTIYGIYKLFMFFGVDLWKMLFKKLGLKIKL